MTEIVVDTCALADEEHDKSLRQYAHVLHHPGVICVADAFFGLPEDIRCGLLAHEVGHLLAVQRDANHSEKAADRAVFVSYGLVIRYRDSEYGDNLECLDKKDVEKFRELFEYLP